MKNEEMEYCYIPKKFATALKEAESNESKEAIILDMIKHKKDDIKIEFEELEERVLQFKLVSLTHKNALQKIRDEEYLHLEKLWEDVQSIRPKIRETAERLANELSPFKSELKEIEKLMQSVNSYHLESLIKLMDSFSRLDSDGIKLMKLFVESNK